jgi:hypothetical protein
MDIVGIVGRSWLGKTMVDLVNEALGKLTIAGHVREAEAIGSRILFPHVSAVIEAKETQPLLNFTFASMMTKCGTFSLEKKERDEELAEGKKTSPLITPYKISSLERREEREGKLALHLVIV